MTTHDFGTTLPLGICSTRLARMVDPKVGMPARTLALVKKTKVMTLRFRRNVYRDEHSPFPLGSVAAFQFSATFDR